jgi:hypothetical protein
MAASASRRPWSASTAVGWCASPLAGLGPGPEPPSSGEWAALLAAVSVAPGLPLLLRVSPHVAAPAAARQLPSSQRWYSHALWSLGSVHSACKVVGARLWAYVCGCLDCTCDSSDQLTACTCCELKIRVCHTI